MLYYDERSDSGISRITDTLYISAFPAVGHIETLRALHVRLIISMTFQRPPREVRAAVARWLHLRTVDSPLVPLPIFQLWRGVEAALPVIREGGGVLTHCRAGVHRSVAMACCILIGAGYTAQEAMALVKEKRPVADPGAWYIRRRILKFEQVWQERSTG